MNLTSVFGQTKEIHGLVANGTVGTVELGNAVFTSSTVEFVKVQYSTVLYDAFRSSLPVATDMV